jgi:uncharacterized membrane protein
MKVVPPIQKVLKYGSKYKNASQLIRHDVSRSKAIRHT